jgi:hypothetical protein
MRADERPVAIGHTDNRRSASGSALAGLRQNLLAAVAALTAVGLVVLAAPGHAYAAIPLARTTDALTGFKDASELRSHNVCAPATPTRATCEAQVLVTSTGAPVHPHLQPSASADVRSAATARSAPAATPEPQPGTPAYMQQAYDLSYLSRYGGGSDTVAIVDAYNDPTAAADLATYRASFGLPPCTPQSGCFREVNQEGGQSPPAQAPGWAEEISLDLDAVSALCPNCHIVLVEANSDNSEDLAAAQAEAASQGVKQITDSWGDPSATPLSGPYNFAGIATVAASGDDGYLGPLSNQYPAAMPDVTAAGGTSLLPASASGTETARGFTEQAWSDAGSGCALLLPKPVWQSDGGCAGRTYSDLSADANPQTGLAVYDSQDGGWLLMGGTSESAPLIAAYYAITGVNGATPQWAYANASLLNPPTGGDNGTCALSILYICVVQTGYSGPTGEGSISGAVVPGAPGLGGPGVGGTDTQATQANGADLQAGIYPNGSDTAYWWQYGTTTAYGHTTTPADAGSGRTPVTVSSTLTGLAAATTYHYRLVASNGYGTSYGYDFTLHTAAGSAAAAGGGAVTAVKVTGAGRAQVRGTVDVENGATSYRFLYGPGGSYRHGTAWNTVWGDAATTVTTTLSGLAPHTTYRVRLVAKNGSDLSYSAPRAFTTGKGSRKRAS